METLNNKNTVNNLNIFFTSVVDGNMNTAARFYKEGMTKEEIRADFDARRLKMGRKNGFYGKKILTPTQKFRPVLDGKTPEEKQILIDKYQSKYQDGHYVRITREMIEPYEDLYDLDIPADILVIDDTLPEVVLAYPVADCPVVIAEDKKNKVVAMAHCGGEYIDRDLPGQIVDSLYLELNSKPEDVHVYIGPHAQKQSFIYDRIPRFVENEKVWSGCLEEVNGVIHVDMKNAILRQLVYRGVSLSNVCCSEIDTITNPLFYSNSAARFDDKKAGRFYTGCFYKKAIQKELVKEKSFSR